MAARKLYLARLRPNTRRAYATGLAQFAAYCRHQGVAMWDAGRALVEAWLVAMRESGLAEATIATRVAAVSGFYRFATTRYTRIEGGQEIALAAINPADGLGLKSQKFGKSEYLSAGELTALLGAIDRRAATGRRDYALLLGYVLTGRRNSEWRTIRCGDIQRVDGIWIYRWSGKGQDNLAYELPVYLARALEMWMPIETYARINLPVFPSPRDPQRPLSAQAANNILRRYARLAGIERPVHIHMLRHSYAMLARGLGADVLTISGQLAHASTATTQIYLDHLEVRRDTLSGQMVQRLGLG